jgi:hypothetical protein
MRIRECATTREAWEDGLPRARQAIPIFTVEPAVRPVCPRALSEQLLSGLRPRSRRVLERHGMPLVLAPHATHRTFTKAWYVTSKIPQHLSNKDYELANTYI